MQKIAKNSEIVALYEGGMGYSEIAARFKVSRQRVYQIVRDCSAPEWARISAFIKVRDRNVCGNCRERFDDLVVHHIDQDPTNNHAKNLISLCEPCHGRYHAAKNCERMPHHAKFVKNADARFTKKSAENTDFLKKHSANPDRD